MLKTLLCTATLLAALASGASAASYTTVIDFTPTGFDGTSTNPADGNQIVIDWATDVTSGIILETHLTDLTFTLNGTGGQIYQDVAMTAGVVQDLAGESREVNGLLFEFDLDDAPTGDVSGLLAFDNDFSFVLFDSVLDGYAIFGGFCFCFELEVLADRFEAGAIIDSKSVNNIIAPVPLPSSGLAAFGALAMLGGLRRRSKV